MCTLKSGSTQSYDEGVANHIGPESCVGFPQGGDEALTGVCAGQVLSCEILFNFRVPTFWDRWKAISGVSPTRDTSGPCAVGDLEHVRNEWHTTALSAMPRPGSMERHGSITARIWRAISEIFSERLKRRAYQGISRMPAFVILILRSVYASLPEAGAV